ncbi:MAG TPA: hypothetical protein VL024_09840 [Castellaniella sp.]|nr:hypothetical protein [Castellaniella sp.]
MPQRIIDLVLSALASLLSLALSWPYWRDFQYWPESHAMWWLYFIVGYLLAVYVFYVFLGSLRTLFQHDEQARAQEQAAASEQSEGGQP